MKMLKIIICVSLATLFLSACSDSTETTITSPISKVADPVDDLVPDPDPDPDPDPTNNPLSDLDRTPVSQFEIGRLQDLFGEVSIFTRFFGDGVIFVVDTDYDDDDIAVTDSGDIILIDSAVTGFLEEGAASFAFDSEPSMLTCIDTTVEYLCFTVFPNEALEFYVFDYLDTTNTATGLFEYCPDAVVADCVDELFNTPDGDAEVEVDSAQTIASALADGANSLSVSDRSLVTVSGMEAYKSYAEQGSAGPANFFGESDSAKRTLTADQENLLTHLVKTRLDLQVIQ